VVRGTPDKVGYLYKQSSGRDVMRWFGEPIASKDLTKKKRRWFVLREMFLGYFKSTQDDTPAGVVPLDYYVMRISDEKAKDKTIILERYECYFRDDSFFFFWRGPKNFSLISRVDSGSFSVRIESYIYIS
jgi:hypothetical protein